VWKNARFDKSHREAIGIGGAVMRVKVVLRCNECKQRNYNTMKNKKNTPERLELQKYCRFCRKHTTHSETK
jgi:large subunit ribosomal protein L33